MDTATATKIVLNRFGIKRGYVSLTEFGMMEFGRAIDVIAQGFWHSNKYRLIAIEIKVSSSDFSRELSDSTKRYPFTTNCEQFYYACPKGLIKPERVPEECGLIYLYDSGRTKIIKEAPVSEIENPKQLYCRLLHDVMLHTHKIHLPTEQEGSE